MITQTVERQHLRPNNSDHSVLFSFLLDGKEPLNAVARCPILVT